MRRLRREQFEVVCPCCGARLKVDTGLGQVIGHELGTKHHKAPDLGHTGRILDKEAARRETLFKQSVEEEKKKSQLLERKFEEALKKSQDQPVTRPPRDIDLD